MRLLRPFLPVLRSYPSFPGEVLEPLEALDPDERVPITTVHELLRGALLLTGDEDLGLKAARELTVGDVGTLEYVVTSAPSWTDAVQLIGRYLRLVNDAIELSLREEGERAVVELHSSVVLPRAAADFQSAAFFIAATLHTVLPPELHMEIRFMHPRPASVVEYARTFGADAKLVFDAPWNGFTFPRELLQAPLRTADPKLHPLIRQHAERLLAELPRAASLTERVRTLIANELAAGDASIERVAKALHLSPRTLGRRLEEESTTFKALREDLRRRLALQYVGGQDMNLSEIALLLGFSDSAAFHRAFKRWTNQTPLEYRRARRG